MMLLSQARNEEDYNQEEVEKKLVHEEGLKEEIQKLAQNEIREFLWPCFQEISRRSSKNRRNNNRFQQIQSMQSLAETQVVFLSFTRHLCNFVILEILWRM
jgi:hypothetical protein